MIKKALISALFLIVIHAGAVRGQQPMLRNFTPTQYNSGTQNWSISQGTDGRMFFANNMGLLWFDGNQWVQIPIANYTNVRAVMYDDRSNVVYAGATNEFGYYCYDPVSRSVVYRSLSDKAMAGDYNFGEIWNVMRWDSIIVFQGKNNFFLCHEDGTVTNIEENHRIESSAVINNRLIFSSRDGVFEISGGRTVELPGTGIMRGRTVRAILTVGSDIIFATSSDGLYRYDGLTTTPYVLDISGMLADGQIFCAAVRDSCMAFGTVRKGLIVKDLRSGAVTYANTYTGLQNNTVLSVMFDVRNNIWLGLDNGISYVVSDAPYYDLIGERNSIGTGYASAVHGGRLYIGTNQGLFYMPLPLRSSPEPPRPKPVSGMAGQVWSLRTIGGRLLCGSDNGAYLVEGTDARRIEGIENTWNFCRLEKHPGYVLASDYNGFYVLKDDGRGLPVLHARLPALAAISSGSIEEDTDGTVWVAHWQKGIYHIRLTDGLTDARVIGHYDKDSGLLVTVNNILCRTSKGILISSVDGFYKYDKAGDRLVYDKHDIQYLRRGTENPRTARQCARGREGALPCHGEAGREERRIRCGQHFVP